jgi:hypothetical protein
MGPTANAISRNARAMFEDFAVVLVLVVQAHCLDNRGGMNARGACMT